MSHITLAQQGIAAVDARRWDEAITKLSQALNVSQNPLWLIARSKALLGAKRYEDALEDADLAWHNAYSRNKRDALAEAQYRRGVSYFRLKKYANADACCIYSMRIAKGHPAVEKKDPTDKFVENGLWTQTVEDAKEEARAEEAKGRSQDGLTAAMGGTTKVSQQWRMASAMRVQILTMLEKLPLDDPARKVSMSLKPPQRKLADFGSTVQKDAVGEAKQDEATNRKAKESERKESSSLASTAPPQPTETPMRLQDFQTDTKLVVTIFSKGNNKDALKVDFQPDAIHIEPIIHPNGEAKAFHLYLWGKINVESATYTVTPNKVELSLPKEVSGKWPQIKAEPQISSQENMVKKAQGSEASQKATITTTDSAVKPTPVIPASSTASSSAEKKQSGPAYPSSSRTGPKDWDSIGKDSDDANEEGVNEFFKKLYQGSNPDQQRAMMKSFIESSGTSLSTDWNDVKDKPGKVVPPEGVEAKKWE